MAAIKESIKRDRIAIAISIVGALWGFFFYWKLPALRHVDEHFANLVTTQGLAVPENMAQVGFIPRLVLSLILAWSAVKVETRFKPIPFAQIITVTSVILVFSSILVPIVTRYAIAGTQLAVSLTMSWLGLLLYRSTWEQGRRAWITESFGKYVSPELVTLIAESPNGVELDGEQKMLTILFSDLKDFTHISEKLTPKELVKFLNEYFVRVTEIILRNGGTVDKFIGDAVMAFWNAPLNQEGHEELAMRSALEILDVSRRMQEESAWGAQFTLATRIGINTGQAIVGNIGSSIRFNYTTVGDTVNLASRLEGLNQHYGTSILVSETTRARIKDKVTFRELDRVTVKGKSQPTTIYEPLERNREALAEKFAQGLAGYRGGNWDLAIQRFTACLKAFPGDSPSHVMLERARRFKSNPPSSWDGTFHFEAK